MDNENNPIEVFILEQTRDIYSSKIVILALKNFEINFSIFSNINLFQNSR
jgi:hypothetical protein